MSAHPAQETALRFDAFFILEQVLYELRLRFVEAAGGGKRIIEP